MKAVLEKSKLFLEKNPKTNDQILKENMREADATLLLAVVYHSRLLLEKKVQLSV